MYTSLNLSTVSGCTTVRAISLELGIKSLFTTEKLLADHAFCIPTLPVRAPVLISSGTAKRNDHLRDTLYFVLPDKRVRSLILKDVPKPHWPVDRRLGKTKGSYAVLTPPGLVIFGQLSVNDATWKQVHRLLEENSDINERLDDLYNYEFADLEASGLTYSAEDKRVLDIVSASAIH